MAFEQEKNDPRSVAELIETALIPMPDEELATSPALAALVVLQAKGSREILEAAKALRRSDDPHRRTIAARILGELGLPVRTFPDECCAELTDMLRSEQDPELVRSACSALGHLGNPAAADSLVLFKDHSDPDVRRGVAFALCGIGSDSPNAVAALLALMEDSDALARDWATTSIGGTPTIDGQEIREALLRRLTDPDDIVRAEALAGLARRGDQRAVEPLIAALSDGKPERHHLLNDAVRIILGLDDSAQITAEQALSLLRRPRLGR